MLYTGIQHFPQTKTPTTNGLPVLVACCMKVTQITTYLTVT